MISPDDFQKYMKASIQSAAGGTGVSFATVIAIDADGSAVIQFAGDEGRAQKKYPALRSYSPVIGDRVMLILGVIIGGWTPLSIEP
jgi:hypothetical protein